MRHDEFPSNRSVLSGDLLSDGTSTVVWPQPLITHQQTFLQRQSYSPLLFPVGPRSGSQKLQGEASTQSKSPAPRGAQETGDAGDPQHPLDKGTGVGGRCRTANHPGPTSHLLQPVLSAQGQTPEDSLVPIPGLEGVAWARRAGPWGTPGLPMAPVASPLPAQQKLESLRHGVADTRGFGEQVWWRVWFSHQTTDPGNPLACSP